MSTVRQEIDSRQLWASRFKKTTSAIGKQYSESITVDRPMFNHDVWGNEAHTIMLGYTGINTDEQTKNILIGLQEVRRQFETGQWDLQLQEEDVQMNVERFVINHVGLESGGRMHTTRSRKRSGGARYEAFRPIQTQGGAIRSVPVDRDSPGSRRRSHAHHHAGLHAHPTRPADDLCLLVD